MTAPLGSTNDGRFESPESLDALAAETPGGGILDLLRDDDTASHPLLEGRQILGMVAVGGFARVYLARNTNADSFEAITVLRAEWASEPEARKRFLREALNASKVEHPNVVKLLDWGNTLSGEHYLVMEYIEGPTIASVLQHRGPFPIARALDIVADIADGLAEAHRLGIVHRDVKPANILLATPADGDPVQHGVPKLADFGLARVMRNPAQTVTNAGYALGTLAYMSPEQRAPGSDVDARCDVYALGCVLYELLTGQQAFCDDVSRYGTTRAVRSVRTLRGDVSMALDAAIYGALEEDPALRFQTAAAMRDKLRECKRGLRRRAFPGRLTSALQVAATSLTALLAPTARQRSRDHPPLHLSTNEEQRLLVWHRCLSRERTSACAPGGFALKRTAATNNLEVSVAPLVSVRPRRLRLC